MTVQTTASATSTADTRKVKDDKKCGGEGKLRSNYIMSPRELESVARRVKVESADKEKKKSS